MAVLGLHSYASFSLVVVSRPYSLFVVASLVAENGLQGAWASVAGTRGLQSTGSAVATHRLICSTACGSFLDQGLNPCLLHWQADS